MPQTDGTLANSATLSAGTSLSDTTRPVADEACRRLAEQNDLVYALVHTLDDMGQRLVGAPGLATAAKDATRPYGGWAGEVIAMQENISENLRQANLLATSLSLSLLSPSVNPEVASPARRR